MITELWSFLTPVIELLKLVAPLGVFLYLYCKLPDSKTYELLFILMAVNAIYGSVISSIEYDGGMYDYIGLATIDVVFALLIIWQGDVHKKAQSFFLALFIGCYYLLIGDMKDGTSIIFDHIEWITLGLTILMAMVGFYGTRKRVVHKSNVVAGRPLPSNLAANVHRRHSA